MCCPKISLFWKHRVIEKRCSNYLFVFCLCFKCCCPNYLCFLLVSKAVTVSQRINTVVSFACTLPLSVSYFLVCYHNELFDLSVCILFVFQVLSKLSVFPPHTKSCHCWPADKHRAAPKAHKSRTHPAVDGQRCVFHQVITKFELFLSDPGPIIVYPCH